MKKITITIALFSILFTGNTQLSNDPSAGLMTMGLGVNYTAIQNTSMDKDDPLRSMKPYFGVLVDVMKNSYDKGDVRYYWTMKAISSDILNLVTINNVKTIGNKHVDFSGFFWGKMGGNVYANDNFCVGIGAAFSDYVVDLPKFTPNIRTTNVEELRYEEPSGWHFTAGPSLFLDYGIGDFIINSNTSYNFSFYRHMINRLYENAVDKIDNYKAPHFFNSLLQIRHASTGLYISFEHSRMIDRGIIGSNLSRNDVALGWIVDMDVLRFWE